jgi:hypothetical protein
MHLLSLLLKKSKIVPHSAIQYVSSLLRRRASSWIVHVGQAQWNLRQTVRRPSSNSLSSFATAPPPANRATNWATRMLQTFNDPPDQST